MRSASLEEGYFIPLVLWFSQYIYSPTFPSLAFNLMLRVHVDNGIAIFKNHGPDNLEIDQF